MSTENEQWVAHINRNGDLYICVPDYDRRDENFLVIPLMLAPWVLAEALRAVRQGVLELQHNLDRIDREDEL